MIFARTWTGAAAIALTLVLAGCDHRTDGAGGQGATAPSDGGGAPAVVVMPSSSGRHAATGSKTGKAPEVIALGPPPTVCGADKLLNYLNLLPTATAKDEIVKTLGHNRVRYVALQEAKMTESATSNRVTAGLGADGRIKEFTCG